MTKKQMYRVKRDSNVFLDYQYSDPTEISSMRAVTLQDRAPEGRLSADRVITTWADYARDALEGDYSESTLACWYGHYEQFGRLMYHMIDVVLRQEAYLAAKRFVKPQVNLFPERSAIEHVVMGPDSSDDRIYYRCWFRLIGHPDFNWVDIDRSESETYTYWQYVLAILALDLGRAMGRTSANDAAALHC